MINKPTEPLLGMAHCPHRFRHFCLTFAFSLSFAVDFPGGVGNTQKDPQRFASLIDDVEQRLFAVLPDETWVYPGHGKDTTIGAERPHLGEWRERGW
jgi:glyoxylase-like metal-dependent hydrolase (beta-lactamase superfamily II)